MSDEEEEIFDEIFRNKLKEVNTHDIEAVIAKAVGDLAGVRYRCEVDDISYGNFSTGKGAKFTVNLSEPSNLFKSDKEKTDQT